MTKEFEKASVELASLEECEYEYIAPELARLYAAKGEAQPDGIYEGDAVQVTVVGNNCILTDGDG